MSKRIKVCRPLNKPRKLEIIHSPRKKTPKLNKRRAFNQAVEPGKNPKSIRVGPTFIPDYKAGLCLVL